MKRSIGVTIFAVLFMISGAFGLLGRLGYVMVGPRMMDVAQVMAEKKLGKAEADLEEVENLQAAGGLDERQVATFLELLKRRVELRKRFLVVFNMFRPHLQGPDMRASMALGGAIAVLTLISGGGIFLLKHWGRWLVFWNAGLSVVALIWGFVVWLPISIEVGSDAMDVMLPGPQDRAHMMAEWMADSFFYMELGRGIIFPLAWLGFIVWFFNRRTVKEQFK